MHAWTGDVLADSLLRWSRKSRQLETKDEGGEEKIARPDGLEAIYMCSDLKSSA